MTDYYTTNRNSSNFITLSELNDHSISHPIMSSTSPIFQRQTRLYFFRYLNIGKRAEVEEERTRSRFVKHVRK
jgi:hypothetical protein